ncbi:WPP domain-associated protein-like isoform X2 [Typha latifolia]|uniref:WPP domain-associated protein-like isoform X2 n=1 Tax=Typha latifolia TaxID=4733 RepID=UPI003C2D15C9
MERTQIVTVGDSEALNERLALSIEGSRAPSTISEERESFEYDSALYEGFLLDVDSYSDGLSDHLSFTRMGAHSDIGGITSPADEEVLGKIVSKEAEISTSEERSQSCKSDDDMDNRSETFAIVPEHLLMNAEIDRELSRLHHRLLDYSTGFSYAEDIERLRFAVEEQLQRLKEDIEELKSSNLQDMDNANSMGVGLCCVLPKTRGDEKLIEVDERVDSLKMLLSSGFDQIVDMFDLVKDSVSELQWEHELQKEISGAMIQNYIRGIQGEFESKLFEQRRLLNTLSKNWQESDNELAAIREELDAISKSLNPEPSMHHGHESFKVKIIKKWKDHFSGKGLGEHLSSPHHEGNGILVIEKSGIAREIVSYKGDYPHLKHMTKEEIVTYFRSEMIKMRRQHDLALQEKTEELFRLKRDFFKGKGLLWKDKELEFLKKRIPEVISKMDRVLLRKIVAPVISNDHDEIRRLKCRIDSILYENQRLQCLIKHLLSKVSDAESKKSFHSLSEAKLLKQIKNLEGEFKDLKIEGNIRDELYQTILRELIDDCRNTMENIDTQTNILQETYSIIFGGVIWDAISTINPIVLKYQTENCALREMLLEKETTLCSGNEENQKLKHFITSLSSLIDEKEKLAKDAESTMLHQRKQFDIVNHEMSVLRDQVGKQVILISDFQRESTSLSSRLDESLQQISKYELEINELNQNLWSTSNALEEEKKKNSMLCGIIEEKQRTLSSSISKEKEQEKKLECTIISMMELSKAFGDVEIKLLEKIGRNENRLRTLSHQFNPVAQQAIQLKKEGASCKQMLEVRCSNLQKAEAEADLLGDKVDALLSILGKVHVAFDQYSPLFQHHPGLLDVLLRTCKVITSLKSNDSKGRKDAK